MQDAYTPHAMDRLRLGQMTRERPMPNTGLFHVLELDAVSGVEGIERVRSIRVRCNTCGGITQLSGDALGAVPGGTTLVCGACPSRQTVSNARLVECDHVLPGSAQGSDA
ncbi:hypothetical protein D7Y51_04290 [Stenotrophomonas maltophilia]|nr:hypothetical protein AR275_21940 [Stenotrophomonas maltophilia]MBA0442336.1 hypothetical protein [Stenotrophomonas maltophilia]OWB47518.1 hypothetical protein B7H27_03200 [Stenotrophomonas maltophilia]